MSRRLTFDEVLVNVVDEVLFLIFKRTGSLYVYTYVELVSSVGRREIGRKPEAFSAGLKRLLGSAAPEVETLILELLYRRLGLRFEWKEDYRFSDYINELRNTYVEAELARHMGVSR